MKKKLILGISLMGIGVGIVLFLLFKDHSQTIGLSDFPTLSMNAQDFKVDDHYIYFKSQDENYKILKTPDLLNQIQAPINKKSNVLLYLGLCLFLVIAGSVAWILRAQRSSPPPSPIKAPENKASQSIISPTLPSSLIRLDHLAGISEVKHELREIIDYLKNPTKYTALGLKMPKGVLLVGPPGVGKTMLAKALANEAGVPFFYQSGSSFAQIFVGSGAKRVQELFTQAKQAQSAIIFIDEIDSVGKARGEGRNDERESTLNQLLTEIDGFNDSSNLIIFGATNRASVLDPALLRSGRFDRKIYIDLPSPKEREEIFALYLKNKKFNFSIAKIAQECLGFSGAMIESLVNEAGLLMLREKREILEERDVLHAKSKLTLWLKKSPPLSFEQKKILALYQAAKAFFALKSSIAFLKISLQEEESVWEKQEMLNEEEAFCELKLLLIGYEALKLHSNQSHTCVQQDLNAAKAWSEKMSLEYGMGERLFMQDTQLITQAQKECQIFLKTHFQEILHLQEILLLRETLNFEEIHALF